MKRIIRRDKYGVYQNYIPEHGCDEICAKCGTTLRAGEDLHETEEL